MQSLQFLSRMALAGKAMVQAPTEFRLPLGIVLFRLPAEVFRQFQALVRVQLIYGSFEIGDAHTGN